VPGSHLVARRRYMVYHSVLIQPFYAPKPSAEAAYQALLSPTEPYRVCLPEPTRAYQGCRVGPSRAH
jgi:hypothetical protein